MQIPNFFQINTWKIEKFLIIVLTIQIAMWGVISLDTIGLQVQILRRLIGFIYLTFVPGILILRILKMHKLSSTEMILYSVGLSIAFLMFTGFFMNMFYPVFGIPTPISFVPLSITISVIVVVLCVLIYLREKVFSKCGDISNQEFIDIKMVFSPSALVLMHLPILALFGTFLVNFYDNHILMYALISIISIIAIVAVFFNQPNETLYPLTIFVVASSLLYHWSLITNNLAGADIHYEHYFANLVTTNSLWSPIINSNINTLLSIVILVPIYSNILDMSIVWIFKIIYPTLYSLVPLGLYHAAKKQTNSRSAFLSVMYFMFVFPFFSEMLQLARQEIAEIFFILLILLMLDKNMERLKRSFLFLVFGISLTVSHYGLSYLYMFCISVAWLLLFIGENPEIQKMMDKFYLGYKKFGDEGEKLVTASSLKKIDRTITSTFVLLFVVFTLGWYIYVSSSNSFNQIVFIGKRIADNIFVDLFNPSTTQATAMILHKYTPLHEITKYLYIISQFFIVIGFITIVFNIEYTKFTREYKAFSITWLIILFFSLSVPHFASSLNTTRVFHITLFVLSVFCVIGVETFFGLLNRVVVNKNHLIENDFSLRIFSVFLMIFLLFTSGLMYELGGENSVSIALNSTFDFPRYNDEEVCSARWIANKNDNFRVYGDAYGVWLLNEIIPLSKSRVVTNSMEDGYLYLREINLKTNQVIFIQKEGTLAFQSYLNITYLRLQKNKIYSNGGSDIYEFVSKCCVG